MPLHSIDVSTAKAWLDACEAVLVDVREPAEFEAQHIAGAVLMPLSTVSKAGLPAGAGKKLIVHCRKGGRGGSACERLLAEDPDLQLYNLAGGIEAWEAAGYAVQNSGKFFLPLDRQVQLVIGLGVLLGSLMGYFVSSGFFLLSGFFGAGLTFAGLSGFCGLAILMAKAPWNRGTKAAKTCCAPH